LPNPRHTMLHFLTFALSFAAAAAAPLGCAGAGSQCSADSDCCPSKGTDSVACESVNQYFSKCVVQPQCAAQGAQCAGTGDSVMKATKCCDAGWSCVATNEFYSHCVDGTPPPSPPSPPPLKCAANGNQCAGSGQSAMDPVPCCTAGWSCVAVNEFYSHCVDGTPPPSPPSPPPETCAADGAQCGGKGFGPGTISCCVTSSTCHAESEWYSKCVAKAPTCAADSGQCAGTGDHVMDTISCCDATETCVKWGADWSVCRDSTHATCSKAGEQCAGTGSSAMDPKACCDPSQTCVAVNQYYSKCDTSPALASIAHVASSCPGGLLSKCIALCPSNPGIAYKACTEACVSRCSHEIAAFEAGAVEVYR